jgi:hypothetical protein
LSASESKISEIIKKRKENRKRRMAAYNTRFGEIGVEVTVRISVTLLTVGVSPNCVRLSPNFVKPPGRYAQSAEPLQ